jgi:hypothetical protein
LILKSDAQSLLVLLLKLRQFYMKNLYQKALTNIDESIIINDNALSIIEKQLIEFENAA